MPSPDVPRFRAEDYTDLNELRALAELLGMRLPFSPCFTRSLLPDLAEIHS